MGWYGGLKDAWKGAFDSIGLDNFITHIPGSGKDAANAAKLAAMIAGAYYAAPLMAAGVGTGGGTAGAEAGIGGGAGTGATMGSAYGGTADTAALMGDGFGSAGGGSLTGVGGGSTGALNSAGMLDYGSMRPLGAGGGETGSFMTPERAKLLGKLLSQQGQSQQQNHAQQIPMDIYEQPAFAQQPQMLPVMNNPYATGLAGNSYA